MCLTWCEGLSNPESPAKFSISSDEGISMSLIILLKRKHEHLMAASMMIFHAFKETSPHKITSVELNDRVRDLDLTESKMVILVSTSVVESSRRKYPKDFISHTSSALQISKKKKVMSCCYINGLLKKLQNAHEAQ
ncbi:hypothetical protein TNCT_16501 [Trichonephila clavata]|uniref:Uncharacterized protein n=1 Tax=Trichonephila clavata TaxID=2740835 RepID=A0A8X6FS83_TRICU|nr:hypothetical protein TNCT_16501 [Trichonephila clavata]